jgi:urease accessory protein
MQIGLLNGNLTSFLKASLDSYAKLNIPFIVSAHQKLASQFDNSEKIIVDLMSLDAKLEAMMLNHVAKRASTAQGIAHLNLLLLSFPVSKSKAKIVQCVSVSNSH